MSRSGRIRWLTKQRTRPAVTTAGRSNSTGSGSVVVCPLSRAESGSLAVYHASGLGYAGSPSQPARGPTPETPNPLRRSRPAGQRARQLGNRRPASPGRASERIPCRVNFGPPAAGRRTRLPTGPRLNVRPRSAERGPAHDPWFSPA